MRNVAAIVLLLLTLKINGQDSNLKLSGFTELESRYFPKRGAYPTQKNVFGSIAGQFESTWKIKSNLIFTGKIFGRVDFVDQERSHFDARELYLQYELNSKVELRIGFIKEYWGRVESNRLVDIVNQTDFLESGIGSKLGQPAISLIKKSLKSRLAFFYFPLFRPRSFPGDKGRLWVPQSSTREIYDTDYGKHYPGLALRYSFTRSSIDAGVFYFHGLSREPIFKLTNSQIIPQYPRTNHIGIDFQLTMPSLLFKGELSHRNFHEIDPINSAVLGVEFSPAIFNKSSSTDFLIEYNYDDRDDKTPSGLNHDLFLGTRYSFNDIKATSITGGVIIDTTYPSRVIKMNISRRVFKSSKITLESQAFWDLSENEFLFFVRNDSHILAKLQTFY